jgi:hypothetical protein
VRFAWRCLEKRVGLTGERAGLVADTTYQVLKRDGPLTRSALTPHLLWVQVWRPRWALKPGPPRPGWCS